MNIVSWNIDTNIGLVEGGFAYDSYPECRVSNRMPHILNTLTRFVQEEKVDGFLIQEGRSFVNRFGEVVNSVTPIVEKLEGLGFEVLTQKYNPSDLAFTYITAVRSSRFSMEAREVLFLTKSPNEPTDHHDHAARIQEIKDHNFGEEWERCVFTTVVKDIKSEEVVRLTNVHLGISKESRIEACRLMNANMQGRFNLYVGDFNAFPEEGRGAAEQREAMVGDQGRLIEITRNLNMVSGDAIDWSFISFIYDFAANGPRLNAQFLERTGKTTTANLMALEPTQRRKEIARIFTDECRALGGLLDLAFQSGFQKSYVWLVPTPTRERLLDYSEAAVKDYILRCHAEHVPAFASDHQPLLICLEM